MDRLGALESRLTVGGQRSPGRVVARGAADHLVEVDGVTHRVLPGRGRRGARPGARGRRGRVRVAPGDDVEAGRRVAVLETMKMETAIPAPVAGRVREVFAVANAQVDAGAPLLRIDPARRRPRPSAPPMIDFSADGVAETDRARPRRRDLLAALQALITGYDVSAERRPRAGRRVRRGAPRDCRPTTPELVAASSTLLTTFADLCELSRNRPPAEEENADERCTARASTSTPTCAPSTSSARACRSGSERGCPGAARTTASTDLEPHRPSSRRPSTASSWPSSAPTDQLPVVAALLERWLDAVTGSTTAHDALAEVLDRLVDATQLRYPLSATWPAPSASATSTEPLIEQARQRRSRRGARAASATWRRHPDAADYADRIEALVASPEPLIRLAERADRPTGTADPARCSRC